MRWLYFSLICLTLAVGGNFSCNPGYTYRPGWYRSHLSTIRSQLETVRDALVDFKKEQGRYPTNDEGLLALEKFKAQLPKDGEPDRYRESAITVGQSGLLSPWQVPYLYENRTGFPPGAFAFSPVNSDPDERYSIRVDDGVFVYSAGAMLFYREYRALMTEKYLVRGGTLAVLAVFILLYAKARPKGGESKGRRESFYTLGRAVAVLTALVVGVAPNVVTCYVMSYFSTRRRPEMVAASMALLEKYRNAGVIREETFEKARKALEQETETLAQRERNR